MTKRGMGRGLAAILPESGIGEPQFRHVPVELIGPNPDQPRTEFDPASIESLAASVADAGEDREGDRRRPTGVVRGGLAGRIPQLRIL